MIAIPQSTWIRTLTAVSLLLVFAGPSLAAEPAAKPDWQQAWQAGPPSAAETKDILHRLTEYVFTHHLKRKEGSPQRGMIYEYFDPARKGEFDQFVQGEALDTMHDGSWLAAAMVHAYRATGDGYYKDWLCKWQLPFYLEMLNHSDTLFSAKVNHARPDKQKLWTESKEWLLQDGEKGFVPYWWDDGGSVSLERRLDKNPLPAFPSFDRFLADEKPNPQFLLSGYSFGSSNHLAQDLGVMLEAAWLLLRESNDPADRKLLAEIAEGCQNLYDCRMRHHGHIPMSDAPWALANGDATLLKHLPDASAAVWWKPNNSYTRALADFAPGVKQTTFGFADDAEYRYYAAIARHGTLPRSFAFKTIYDAYTDRLLYRIYSDDAAVPPGINRFDLHPIQFVDGKPTDYRSDRKGPGKGPRPIGSRMGPQTMVVCGWALQALKAYPGIWDERLKQDLTGDVRVTVYDPPPSDAKAKPPEPTKFKLGGCDLSITATFDLVELTGHTDADSLELTIFARPDRQMPTLTLKAGKDGKISVTNSSGKDVEFDEETCTGKKLNVRVKIPYAFNDGQTPWLSMIEYGRYSIAVGDDARNVTLASSEAQVKAWLEQELGGGLRTWDAIFRQWGYVPTGIAAGANWEKFSDAGGYAHLASAASQWLLYLDGKRDWDECHVPKLLPGK